MPSSIQILVLFLGPLQHQEEEIVKLLSSILSGSEDGMESDEHELGDRMVGRA